MRQIHYKQLPPTGSRAGRVVADLQTFLEDIPSLLYLNHVPPLCVVNAILASGHMDAGMGGGARWKPFTVAQEEYAEVIAIWRERGRSRANTTLRITDVPTHVHSRLEWCVWVLHVELGVPYEAYRKLMLEESELDRANEEAARNLSEDQAEAAHMRWYSAACAANEFLQPYMDAYHRREPRG